MKTRPGLLLAASCLFAASAGAQTLDVVHRFQEDGGAYGRLIQATDGNFYGTTSWGGTYGVGTVFKLDGSGSVTTLHSFGHFEGAYPKAALLQGADGNFYGTASAGGANNLGTIFKMDPTGSVTLVHSFGGPEGANPWAPLIQTADGNFYGTAHSGGAGGFGTAFKMDSAGSVTPLHSFEGGAAGFSPYAALLAAATATSTARPREALATFAWAPIAARSSRWTPAAPSRPSTFSRTRRAPRLAEPSCRTPPATCMGPRRRIDVSSLNFRTS